MSEAKEKTDLIVVKELLLKGKLPYETSRSGAAQGSVRTYLTMETLVSRVKIVFQFSNEDRLVGIETM